MKHGNIKDLTGQVFGWLTVKSFSHSSGNSYWHCVCKCGKELVVKSNHLRTGHRTSCGCKRKYDHSKHGESGIRRNRLYTIWGNMIQRCENPNNTAYRFYGGRGVTICNDWHNYILFKDWALSHDYSDSLTIDRIDSNGNYCPENCRWVTQKAQMRNIRTNNNITINGTTKPISEWSEIHHISQESILKRIRKGWSTEKAIMTPTDKYNHRGKKNVAS